MSYENEFANIRHPKTDDLIRLSQKYVPKMYQHNPWAFPELNHGCAILSSKEALCCYIAAYGEMHITKCKSVFRNFPFDNISSTMEIFDWGCGQGIGSACFVEMLEERQKLNLLQKVTLIEPSSSALYRAELHIRKISCGSIAIVPIEQYLPGDGSMDEIDSIHYEKGTIVHIFSNVLDIDAINLEKLAKMLPSANQRQFIMCVGPQNSNYYRIDKFVSIFQPQSFLTDISDGRFGVTSSTHRVFGCHAKCFEYNNTALDIERMNQIVAPISICGHPILDDYDPMLAVQNSTLSKAAVPFLKKLQTLLTEEDYLYIKPNINGDTPDIIVLRPYVGIFIFQIFDYTLEDYRFGTYKHDGNDKINHTYIVGASTELSAPHIVLSQYKENLIRLHMERTAENVLVQKGYWSIVKSIGFFPNCTTACINDFYGDVKHKYEFLYGSDFLERTDMNTFEHEIGLDERHNLFDSIVKDNFIRIVSPGWHSYKEGIPVNLNKAQRALAKSQSIEQKIKGTAGSGKTMVLAHRAVKAQFRTNQNVLILTFNLSLTNYLRYRISQVREDFSRDKFYISNYHQFIKNTARNLGLHLKPGSFEDIQLFENIKTKVEKYPAIFIDEVQDYQPEWLRILHDYFLTPGGEFVVFGDSRQNIYKLPLDENGDVKIGIIRGVWNGELEQGYRFNNGQLNTLANQYQLEFFNIQNNSQEMPNQIDFGVIQYCKPQDNSISNIAATCVQIIHDYKLPINDTVVLSETHDIIRNIDNEIRKVQFLTLTTTERQEQYELLLGQHNNQECPKFKADLEELRRTKKLHFRMKDNCMKLSTIHSYKGWEAGNVILIIEPEYDTHDKVFVTPEVIYTGITRARNNLFIVSMGNDKYDKFFSQYATN